MAGIIRGNLLDAEGNEVNPGKPVTLKAVRSDGLPDVTITTNDSGHWSLEVNAEVDSQVDFTFIYNGVDVGAHAVRFIETAEVVTLPYSNFRIKVGNTGVIAFAVKDDQGNGVPYADVTIHRDDENSEPVATVKTDGFGIATYTTPRENSPVNVNYFAKAGGNINSNYMQWEDGEEEGRFGIGDFKYIEKINAIGRGSVSGTILDAAGEPLWVSDIDIFNKDTLESVTTQKESINVDGFLHTFDSLPEGKHHLVAYTEGQFIEFTVESGTFPNPDIHDVTLPMGNAKFYPSGSWSNIYGQALESDGSNHTPTEFTTIGIEDKDGQVRTVSMYPDGSFIFSIKGEVGETVTEIIKNTAGEEVVTHQGEFIAAAELKTLPYSVTTLYTNGTGDVAFALLDAEGKGIPYAQIVTWDPDGYGQAVTDEFGIVETSVSKNGTATSVRTGVEFGSKSADHEVSFSGSSVASEFRNMSFPSVGDTVNAMTISGRIYDQGGNGFKPSRLGVFDKHTLGHTPVDMSSVNGDGTFSFDFGPLEKGKHNLVLGTTGVTLEKATEWAIGFPPGLRTERLNYSSYPNIYIGDEGLVAYRASLIEDAKLIPVVGIPASLSVRVNGEWKELETKLTDDNGIVEYSLPPEIDGVQLSGYHEVRCVMGPNTESSGITWVNDRDVISEFGYFDYTNPVNTGGRLSIELEALNQDGTKGDLADCGVVVLNSFFYESYLAEITENAKGTYSVSFPTMPDGDHDVVFYSGNAQRKLSLTWGGATANEPAGIQLDPTSPTSAVVDTVVTVSGSIIDSEGNVVRPVEEMELSIRDENATTVKVKVGPSGSFSFEATSDTIKTKTYSILDDGNNLYVHQVEFIASPVIEFANYTGDKVAKTHNATLAVVVKDADSNGIEGMLVNFTNTYDAGVDYGKVVTDEFGVAELVLSYNPDTITTPSTPQDEVTAFINGTDLKDNRTIRWASDTENSAIEIADLVISPQTYVGQPIQVTGKLVGNLSQSDTSIMWLVVFNKSTLGGKMFNGNINSDGTFDINIGPYDLGANELVFATNSAVIPSTVFVTEAPIVLKELRTLPYSTSKVKQTGSATLAFAGINSVDKPMVGQSIELRLGSDTGLLVDTKTTDEFGIVEFMVNDNPDTPNSGDLTYFVVSEGISANAIVEWGVTNPVVEELHGFEATRHVADGEDGVIKLSPLSHMSYASGPAATDPGGNVTPWETKSHVTGAVIRAFDKRTLQEIVLTEIESDLDIYGERFNLYRVPTQTSGDHELVIFGENAAMVTTMTWDEDTALVKPTRFNTLNNSGNAFIRFNLDQWIDGTAIDGSGDTAVLTGYVEAQISDTQNHPVYITPKGRFVAKLGEGKPAGKHPYNFKVDGVVIDTQEINYYDQLNVTLLPYSTPKPAKGRSATVGVIVKDGNGDVVPDACLTFTPGARNSFEYKVNVKSDFNGMAEVTWNHDESFPEFTMSSGYNGGVTGESLLIRWVESPELTGDRFETLVVPEKVVGDDKAVITGKILDQDGNPYANGELAVYNKTEMTNTVLTDNIQPDGTFSVELGPYPFKTYELIFATLGNIDRQTTRWGGSGILASIEIDPDSGTRGLLGDTVEIFGSSTDTIGTPFTPDEGIYTLDVVNDKNDDVLPTVIDAQGNWSFNATHDVSETITYTFKDGETVLATHAVEFFEGAGTLRNFDVPSTVKVGLNEDFSLTGKVYNTMNQLYRPIVEELFTLVLDETTEFQGTIHTDGTFSVKPTNDQVETQSFTFKVGENTYDTVDIKWCQTVSLVFNADSQPKAVVGDDAYVSIRVVDENGESVTGRVVEFYEGDVSGDPLGTENIYSETYIGYWPKEATEVGDVVITAKLGGIQDTLTLSWVGSDPKIAAGFGRKTSRTGYVVDTKPASGTTATLRGTVVDQDGTPLAGPQFLKVFDQGSFDLTDYSAQVQADGTFDIELPVKPDGTYNYSLVTEGNVGSIRGISWDAENEDLKAVKLDASVPTQVNVATTHTLQGTILDSAGDPIAPAKSITVYVNSSEGNTYEFTVTPDGTWSFAYTFSDEGDVLFDFHTYQGKYLGSVTITVEEAAPVFTSIEWVGEQPTEGMVGESVKLTAVTLDQYGDPIDGVSVRPFINGEPQNAFRSPPGGSWSLDYTSTEAGPVLYEFGWEPDVARIGHTVEWKLPVDSIEVMRYSDSNAVPGQTAFVPFAALDSSGKGIAGVPIALHLDSASGTLLTTVTTNEFGIAEFNVPQKGSNANRLIYAKYGDLVKERRQWWANDPLTPPTGFANLTVTNPVPEGERALVSVQAVASDGNPRPLSTVGIFDPEILDQVLFNRVTTGESKSHLLDFAHSGTGTKTYILTTDAGRQEFSVTWESKPAVTPNDLVFDADSPESLVVGEWNTLSGKLAVDGVPVTELDHYVKATMTVGGKESYLDLDVSKGTFRVLVKPTAAGTENYDFKLNGTSVVVKSFRHSDNVTLNDVSVLSVTTPQIGDPVVLSTVVKDSEGNPIPKLPVTFKLAGGNTLATLNTDVKGMVTHSVPYQSGTMSSNFEIKVGSVVEAVTATWKPTNELIDVAFEGLTTPATVYDGELAKVTGKLINQQNNGTSTTKFEIYHRGLLTHTSHATDVQPDGTFDFNIGPFTVGVNEFYFIINGKRIERSIEYIERTDPELNRVELDEGNPTSGFSGENLTISGKGYDQYGDPIANAQVQWAISGDAQPALTTGPDGSFSTTVTHNTNASITYRFGGNDDIPVANLSIAWTVATSNTMAFVGTSQCKQTQNNEANIELYVKDQDGVGVQDAQIVIRDQGSETPIATLTTNVRGLASYAIPYEAGNDNRTIEATLDQLTETLDITWYPAVTKYATGFTRLYMDNRPASGKSTTVRGQLVDQEGNPITTASTLGIFNTITLENHDYIDRLQPDGTFEFEYGPEADSNYPISLFTDAGHFDETIIWDLNNADMKRVVFDNNIPRMTKSNGRVSLHGTFVDSDGSPFTPLSNTACTATGDNGDAFTGTIKTDGTFEVEVWFPEYRTHKVDISAPDKTYLGTYSLVVTADNIIDEMPYSANVATTGQPATMAVKVVNQSDVAVEGTEVTAHLGDPSNPAVVTANTDARGIATMNVPAPAETGKTTVYFKNGTSVLDAEVDWKPVEELVGKTFQDVVTSSPAEYGQPATISGKLLDQNGDVLPGRNLGVYHLNGGTLLDTTVVKNDGTGFTLEVGPLTTGTHQLVLFTGNAERYEEITWNVEIPPIGKLETVSFSSTKAPSGQPAKVHFYVLAPNYGRVKDVPVTARWGNAQGEVIATEMTNSEGLVSYTLPGTDESGDRLGVHTVYVEVGGKSITDTVEWVDDELIGQSIIEIDNMQNIEYGEKFLVRMTVRDQNNEPIRNPGYSLFQPKSRQEVINLVRIDYPGDDVVFQATAQSSSVTELYVGTDNDYRVIPVNWDYANDIIKPVTAAIDVDVPEYHPVGVDSIVKGKVLDTNGLEFRPTTILKLKARRVSDNSETELTVMPDGEWAFVVNEPTESEVVYKLMYGNVELMEYTAKFGTPAS
ncbi:hypothetical protein HWC35_gp160 [Vibrio phage USC-1]|uniref:Uncharacterized protein n=2 Tax=Aphroditevirus USC1 TaxID=2846605 RepID=A0A514A2P7_9CAUD|nr:hypothetical protein HWC35_gp160 [Vibrio phage USC-1]QCW23175.1 hypothetical protein [Vibrio phage 5 TSL-2019]QDH47554.1 hypothetical protein [Vibrio phage USC-1]